jgi:glutamate racemase
VNRLGPIGIFDSGAGGLSVWRELVRELPHEDTLYVADQLHMPYGPRTEEELRRLCAAITRFLIAQGCKAIVVACNTASAAALKHLRETFPSLPAIGMEPAVKPAAGSTRSGVVGIMATPATFQGRLFQATAGRHASSIRLINQVCDGLAEQVERGELNTPATEAMLRRYLEPMLAAGADTVVLACTHYPFVIELIRQIVGPDVQVIDPAPAIARHVRRTLEENALLSPHTATGVHRFFSTGTTAGFASLLQRLLGVEGDVCKATWRGAEVVSGVPSA